MPIGHFSAAYATPSLGMAYIAGTLKHSGHDVFCIDSVGEKLNSYNSFGRDDLGLMVNGLTIPEIIAKIPKDSDCIAISLMFSNEWIHHKHLIAAIIEAFPNRPLVLGGEHVTADYQAILSLFPQITACVLGEGEETIMELMGGDFTALEKVAGIAFYDHSSNRVLKTDKRKRIKELKDIAWPDWSGVPLTQYLSYGLGYNSPMGKRAMPMLASRGCPYQCTFCSNATMWTRTWYPRDINDLIAEIKLYIGRYGIDHIDFHDLTAVVNKKWILEFCKRFQEEGFNISWALPAGTRSEALDREVLQALYDSGCRRIIYAPESGDQKTLLRIKKQVNLVKMKHSIKEAVSIGHLVKAHIIMGLPEQTKREVFNNFIFMIKLAYYGVHDVSCFGYSPYPGTEEYKRLTDSQKLKRDQGYEDLLATNVYNCMKNMRSWSDYIPDYAMLFITIGGSAFFYMVQFLLRPWRLVSVFRNIVKSRATTTLELTLYSMFKEYKKL
jgi:anaerobic magnesium-protoporphyrin IX monomethyl ester cyclase